MEIKNKFKKLLIGGYIAFAAIGFPCFLATNSSAVFAINEIFLNLTVNNDYFYPNKRKTVSDYETEFDTDFN